jgi:hypothetical protein
LQTITQGHTIPENIYVGIAGIFKELVGYLDAEENVFRHNAGRLHRRPPMLEIFGNVKFQLLILNLQTKYNILEVGVLSHQTVVC